MSLTGYLSLPQLLPSNDAVCSFFDSLSLCRPFVLVLSKAALESFAIRSISLSLDPTASDDRCPSLSLSESALMLLDPSSTDEKRHD